MYIGRIWVLIAEAMKEPSSPARNEEPEGLKCSVGLVISAQDRAAAAATQKSFANYGGSIIYSTILPTSHSGLPAYRLRGAGFFHRFRDLAKFELLLKKHLQDENFLDYSSQSYLFPTYKIHL